MIELKWLDTYSGQTTDELFALAGEYRPDSLVLVFEQALGLKAERVGVEGLSEEELIILAVEALEREVNNGGYSQFFYNSSKEYTPVVVDALNRIGCPETAKLTRKAIDVLNIDEPISVDAIDNVMEQEDEDRDEKLWKCDDRYYETAEDLAGNLLEFIKDNSVKIVLNR